MKVKTIDSKEFSLSAILNNKASIFLFLSPECPLCQSYSLTINELIEEYQGKGMCFYMVFSGTYYTVQQMRDFVSTYHLNCKVLLQDKEFELSKILGASITPEAFVLNNKGEVVYRGRIDNWAYELGKKRTNITEHDLKNALTSIVENNPIKVSKTQAIGCIIE